MFSYYRTRQEPDAVCELNLAPALVQFNFTKQSFIRFLNSLIRVIGINYTIWLHEVYCPRLGPYFVFIRNPRVLTWSYFLLLVLPSLMSTPGLLGRIILFWNPVSWGFKISYFEAGFLQGFDKANKRRQSVGTAENSMSAPVAFVVRSWRAQRALWYTCYYIRIRVTE